MCALHIEVILKQWGVLLGVRGGRASLGMGSGDLFIFFVRELTLCINCVVCGEEKKITYAYIFTRVYVYIYTYQQINKKEGQVLCFVKVLTICLSDISVTRDKKKRQKERRRKKTQTRV